MPSIVTTAGNIGDTNSTAAELINALEADTLEVAKFTTEPLEQAFMPYSIMNAKTMQWNRFERIPITSAPSASVEGENPDPISITIDAVTATLEQYDATIQISELAQATSRHDTVREVIRRVGTHMGDARMLLLYDVADAAANTFRVADRANDNALAVGDTLSYEEAVDLQSELDSNGVPTYSDGTYKLVAHTNMYASLKKDPNWLAMNQFPPNDEDIRRGVVGQLDNVEFIKCNHYAFASTASTTSGNSSKIRSGFLCGMGFLGVTSLNALDRQIYVDPPGTHNDPARKRFQVTWKMTFKAVILDEGFGRRVRASCEDATAVA